MPPKPTREELLRRIHDSPDTLVRVGDPIIDPFREAIVQRNGGSYLGLVRVLHTLDQRGDKKLTAAEFIEGLEAFQLRLRREDVHRLFKLLDHGNKGVLSVSEFMSGIRPEMSMARRDLVLQAFSQLDPTGSGFVSLQELKDLHDCSHHPAVICGRKTEAQIREEFASDWDRNFPNGAVSLSHFFEYYTNLSSVIASDDYFELMVRNAWHLYGGEGLARNTTCMRVEVVFEDGRRGMFEVRNDLRIDKRNVDEIKTALCRQGIKNIKAVTLPGS